MNAKQLENVKKMFKALEKDREDNGTRYDEPIDIECPVCGGVMTYAVSSYNGHRQLSCNICNVSIRE